MKDKMEGILVVSFGTSYLNTKKETIDRIVEDIKIKYEEYSVYEAYTSKMILKHLLKRDNIKINNVKQAMEEIIKEGIKKIIIQPTHILNGIENDIMKEDVQRYRTHFDEISFGTPLLTTTEDNTNVLKTIIQEYNVDKNEAYVLMGHGSEHYVNTVYAALDYTLKDMGYSNVFVGTVEAYPSIEVVLNQLKRIGLNKIHLIPLMVVAGDHAHNDMAGDKEDSWKSILSKEGYEVECHLKGLGEIKGIRDIYLDHLSACKN